MKMSRCGRRRTQRARVTTPIQWLSRWPQREVEELRRDIRNLWHCESNQGIFIMMSAIGSDRKLYGCDM
jgi:hypothetical protein